MSQQELSELPMQEADHNGALEKALGIVETSDENELRALILNLDDTVEEVIPIPEWKVNGKVVQILVRAMTADDRVLYIKVLQQSNLDMRRVYADMAIACARHPLTKKLIWKAADRDAIMKKHGMAIERIAKLAADLSGLSDEAMKSLKKS